MYGPGIEGHAHATFRLMWLNDQLQDDLQAQLSCQAAAGCPVARPKHTCCRGSHHSICAMAIVTVAQGVTNNLSHILCQLATISIAVVSIAVVTMMPAQGGTFCDGVWGTDC